MKLQHLFPAAILAALSVAPVYAAPMIQFVDNLDSSVTLQIAPDPSLLPGSLATETAFSVQGSGVTFTGATIADSVIWDTANPGDNPFTGTVTNGIFFGVNEIFASYGSDVLNSPGFTDFLTITYTGAGTIDAAGLVAQAGQSFLGLTSSITVPGSSPTGPQLQFVDNGDGTVTLQVVVDAIGSLGAETAVVVDFGSSLTVTEAIIADTAVWDTPNPGSNPFTGGVTNGLYTDMLADGKLFASYGSGIVVPGVYDFLTLTYSGSGSLVASGLVAQDGQLNGGLLATINLIPEPTTAVLVAIGLAGFVARRRFI